METCVGAVHEGLCTIGTEEMCEKAEAAERSCYKQAMSPFLSSSCATWRGRSRRMKRLKLRLGRRKGRGRCL